MRRIPEYTGVTFAFFRVNCYKDDSSKATGYKNIKPRTINYFQLPQSIFTSISG